MSEPSKEMVTTYRATAPNYPLVLWQILTSHSITGTSMSTPTTVASAAPDERPKSIVAVAIATSKWFEAPIIGDGAASSYESLSTRARP
jgi:hypothetical protein